MKEILNQILSRKGDSDFWDIPTGDIPEFYLKENTYAFAFPFKDFDEAFVAELAIEYDENAIAKHLEKTLLPEGVNIDIEDELSIVNFLGDDLDVRKLLSPPKIEKSTVAPTIANIEKNESKREMVNLQRFIINCHRFMLFKGSVYWYSSGYWQLLSSDDCKILIRETLEMHELANALTSGDYSEIYKLLTLCPEIKQDEELEPPEHSINFLDGTFNIERMEFYEHAPEDFFFDCIKLRYRDVENAEYGFSFENFVRVAGNGDPDVRRQLLELTAIALTGTQAKCFYVIQGPSHSGKTQFGRFLSELIGREHTASIAGLHEFQNQFTSGAIGDKKLATCLDLPDIAIPQIAISNIKGMTGDDAWKTERKNKDSKTVYKTPLLLCASNYPVHIPAGEEALKNRLITIPFYNAVSLENQTQQFFKVLLSESAYIVREAIYAYRELLDRNFVLTQAELPEEYLPTDPRRDFRAVKQFIDENAEQCENHEMATDEIYVCYCEYAKAESLPHIEKLAFSKLLKEVLSFVEGIVPIKRTNGTDMRGYRGILIHGA